MRNPIRPTEALGALRRLIANPEATEEVFTVLRSLDGRLIERLHERVRATPAGRRLLAERPDLIAILADRARLAAMPEGSLGREYLAFCDREGITPGGLVEASDHPDRQTLDPELLWLANRLRDSHDLWHVVTGCRSDLGGELGLLAFTTAQTRSVGTATLVAAGYARSFTLPGEIGAGGRQLARSMFVRGLRAEWLPVADWEALLPLPLAQVRARLGVEPVPPYQPFYTADLARN